MFRRFVLTGKTSFDHLFLNGRWYHGKQIKVVIVHTEPQKPSRFAICLGRSIRGAVLRNRYKRVLREALEPLVTEMIPGLNIGVFPAPGFLKLKPDERVRAIRELFVKNKFLVEHS